MLESILLKQQFFVHHLLIVPDYLYYIYGDVDGINDESSDVKRMVSTEAKAPSGTETGQFWEN